MGWELLGSVVCMLLWAVWTINKKCRGRRRRVEELRVLPPGPRRWPLVGNILQLSWPPHESFAKLAREHGPIMTLWLGSMGTVVISSDKVARDMFKNHDVVLAGRKTYEAMKGGFGTDGSIIMAQYGPEWRTLRRLCTTEFFVTSRLDATQVIPLYSSTQSVHRWNGAIHSGCQCNRISRHRREEVLLLDDFQSDRKPHVLKRSLGPQLRDRGEFLFHTGKVLELVAKPNFADFLPILQRFDPQGIRRKTQFHLELVLEITGGFIRERMEARGGDCEEEEERSRDYMDVLLEHRGDGVEGPLCFSSASINATVLEMFIAGTDTTTSTLEWAMAELLHNPRTLQKLQAELRTVVKLNQKLEEKHLENLPYLKAVIKETLRLHPPLPFLVPHRAMDSLSMLGYHIPKEIQILVNVRAIGRDPQIWKTPLEFRPERFLEPNINVDYMGHHFEFIPFGSGRRICPALPLASRVLSMTLGSILLAFDWILEDGVEPSEMDMSEHMGATLKKAIPLKAVAIPYKG